MLSDFGDFCCFSGCGCALFVCFYSVVMAHVIVYVTPSQCRSLVLLIDDDGFIEYSTMLCVNLLSPSLTRTPNALTRHHRGFNEITIVS